MAPIVAKASIAVVYCPPLTIPHGWWCRSSAAIEPLVQSLAARAGRDLKIRVEATSDLAAALRASRFERESRRAGSL